MEGYFHVSFTPIPTLKNTMPLSPSSVKTSTMYGKPMGLWYSLGLAWLPIMNRDYARGISDAIQMSLGVKSVVDATPNNQMAPIYPSKVYVYSLSISDIMKTEEITEPNTNLILKITSTNLGMVLAEYETYKTREKVIEYIQLYFYNIFYKDLDPLTFLEKYFKTVETPDEEEDWYAQFMEYYEDEESDILEYIQEEVGTLSDWLNESVERVFDEKQEQLFQLDPKLADFVDGFIWSSFWKEKITPRFAGVEFDSSVVGLEGGPIWTRFLDISSGCLFRPKATGVTLQLVTQLSLDAANTTRNMSVYGKTKSVGTVKRVRVSRGSRRTKRNERKTRRNRK